MTTRHYIAVADLAPGERMWSIVFPDFPGVTSAAAEFADVPQQARDALATAVEDIVAEGEDLPPSVEEGRCTEADPAEFHDPRYVVVPVEVPEGSARINVSIDRSLLKRIDEAALRRGMTRSGFLAEGARKLLRAPPDQGGSRQAPSPADVDVFNPYDGYAPMAQFFLEAFHGTASNAAMPSRSMLAISGSRDRTRSLRAAAIWGSGAAVQPCTPTAFRAAPRHGWRPAGQGSGGDGAGGLHHTKQRRLDHVRQIPDLTAGDTGDQYLSGCYAAISSCIGSIAVPATCIFQDFRQIPLPQADQGVMFAVRY